MKSIEEIEKRLKYSIERFDELNLEIKRLKSENRSFVVESYQITKIGADLKVLEWVLK